MSTVKKIVKILAIALAVVLAVILLALGYLTLVEYRPAAVEDVPVTAVSRETIKEGESYTLLSFNIGYAGLGEKQDFFMDGGNMVAPEKKEDVEENLAGIADILQRADTDFYFLQEADINSTRSFHINESALLGDTLALNRSFAYNFNCTFVPYPIPMIGHVESGLTTLSAAEPESAQRVSLPVPFSWPVRLASLKRCLLVSRFSLENSEKELVMINLHLEAYDDGAGKEAQTKMLRELFRQESAKGNYVIAGGDFNQSFPGMVEAYPMLDESYWTPGVLRQEDFAEMGSLTFDGTAPTCRLLNGPYDPQTAQYYCIDGFIVSPNVQVEEIKTLNENFKYADHNPVRLVFRLGEA